MPREGRLVACSAGRREGVARCHNSDHLTLITDLEPVPRVRFGKFQTPRRPVELVYRHVFIRDASPAGGSRARSSLGLCRFCQVRHASIGFGGEITELPTELETCGQGEPALLHVQKVLLKGRIGLSGGFPRTFFRVLVILVNLLAQILKHRTHCLAGEGTIGVSQSPTPDVFLVGDGTILRPQHAWHNATNANLTTLGEF